MGVLGVGGTVVERLEPPKKGLIDASGAAGLAKALFA